MTNVRSVSDNPDLAVRLLKQVISGMQDYGLATTAKHFPGDGTDYRDQHLTMTKNSLSYEEWLANHGKVFKSLIMGGFLKHFERGQAEIECFKVGTDILLWCTLEYIDRMESPHPLC